MYICSEIKKLPNETATTANGLHATYGIGPEHIKGVKSR